MRKLKYFDLYTTDPCFNLACEQFIFENLPTDCSYIMLWQNKNTVVVGKYQNTYGEVNAEYAAKNNIKVVRRLSGGGAVYHDLGNLNFSFITDAVPNAQLDLHILCTPIIRILRDLGIPAEINGRNDITIEGKKISGNSQYLKHGRIMHHGTLLFDSDLRAINEALRVDDCKVQSKGIKSVESRVTNIKEHIPGKDMDISEFRKILLCELLRGTDGEEYIFSSDELEQIKKIRDERYSCWEWNYGSSPNCAISRKKRFDGCGTVEAHISISGSTISELKFSGDFFSAEDPEKIEGLFLGMQPRKEEIEKVLSSIDISKYFLGMDNQGFTSLLTGE